MKTQDAYKLIFREYPDVVTVEQMCEMLGGLSTKTGYQLLKSGAINYFVLGRRYRIPKVSILEYIGIIENSAI